MVAVSQVLNAVRSVIGDGPAKLHEPLLQGKEREYVGQVIASGHLSAGPWVERFEAMLCEATGAKYAVATCGGTAALHTALACSGLTAGTIKIPALTFVATANAALQAGMRPHFVEPEHAHIPVDLNGVESPAKGIVRDSAQSFGIPLTGTRIYSFNQNKPIACIGGAVVTDDTALADKIRKFTTTARVPHDFLVEHDGFALNYRLSDIHAAIGVAQLEQWPVIKTAKEMLAKRYKEAFDAIGVKMWPGTWLNSIMVDNRDEIIEALHQAGYKARCLPTPLHTLPHLKNCPKDDLSRTMAVWKQVVQLPSSPRLGLKYA